MSEFSFKITLNANQELAESHLFPWNQWIWNQIYTFCI